MDRERDEGEKWICIVFRQISGSCFQSIHEWTDSHHWINYNIEENVKNNLGYSLHQPVKLMFTCMSVQTYFLNLQIDISVRCNEMTSEL